MFRGRFEKTQRYIAKVSESKSTLSRGQIISHLLQKDLEGGDNDAVFRPFER